MAYNPEEIINFVYAQWKRSYCKDCQDHPDVEELVSLTEGKLSVEKDEEIKRHLLACNVCCDELALNLSLSDAAELILPLDLEKSTKRSLGIQDVGVLEIVLKLKEKAIEVIKASGDILLGEELIPAAVLRSRNLNNLKDEVVILKDINDIRVRVKIENKSGKYFNVVVQANDRHGKGVLKDIRVSLFKDDLEVESYLSDSGAVIFEHVLLGKYRIELSGLEENFASVIIDVKA